MPPSTAPQPPNVTVNNAQSALVEGLQPTLRRTLSSLNINLDYELARYRHAKRGEAPLGGTPTPLRPRRQPSLDLINVAQSAPTARPGAPLPPPLLPNPKLQSIELPSGMAESTSEVAALRSAIVRQPAAAQDGYMAATDASSRGFAGGGGASFSAAVDRPRRRPAKWLTPLGLGALLLLLVSSAGLGFLLVNPTAASNLFQQTPLARFFPNTESDGAVTAAGDAVAEETAEAIVKEPPLTPLSPDLSQREFSDLELNNLSTLPSSSISLGEIASQGLRDRQSEPSAGDRAAIARNETTHSPQQVNQIPTATTPAPQPAAPVYQAPAQAPAAESVTQPAPPRESRTQPAPPPMPAASPAGEPASQSPQSSYYVVTDYTGDPSLDDARTVVQDAYVRNFEVGARIQLGAFSTQAGATELTEALREQGLEAEVYEP
ncbi:MAG: hypothetical protein AAGD09_07105 [Cyanobacteria bacterium P01_F01_bin.56]